MVHSLYFERAPIVERVLGVQFQPLANFHSGLLGAFWKTLGEDWSSASDAPPLAMQHEQFGPAAWNPFRSPFSLVSTLSGRFQLLNRAGDRMIQFQNGRFHFNWKGQSGEGYVRFPDLLKEFDSNLQHFVDFLTKEAGGDFLPNQWEVTYLNHIPKGTVWQTPSDWPQLFRSLVIPPAPKEPLRLETFGGNWHFEIVPQQGRLHVEIAHAQRESPSPEELLVFSLTARGPLKRGADDRAELLRRLDFGSDAIVGAFQEFTSEPAHQYWGIRNAAT